MSWVAVAVAGGSMIANMVVKNNTKQPGAPQMTSPGDPAQINQAYTQSQNAIQQQQNLVMALQQQQGISNQSNVFQQQQNIANGVGANPAQAMLNQQTGNNVAQQSALMAGQRGAAGNVGLMARQAGQNGANIQQNAVGQAATLQANQSLNALNNMGAISGQQVANQMGAVSNLNTYNQGMQNTLMGNAQAGNSNSVNAQNNANNIMQQQNMQNNQMIGGGLQGLGTALGTALGGDKKDVGTSMGATNNDYSNMAAEGGAVDQLPSMSKGPKSKFAQSLVAPAKPQMAEGGAVPAMVSPGEKYLSPQDVQAVKQGANPMEVGEKIPGKPKVGGAKNDYANDTVPKTLEEGGIVLPRSVTQSKNPHWAAHAFVSKIMAAQGGMIPTKPKAKK